METYPYQKERNQFGRECLFTDKNEFVESIPNCRELFDDYILKNPFSQGTQYAPTMALSDINTERILYNHTGWNHIEGGWPKEVAIRDPEQTFRYRRKIEKSDTYVAQLNRIIPSVEHTIYSNNAVNIYEDYFDGQINEFTKMASSTTINVYRDTNLDGRPVVDLSWSPDNGTKIAIAHCDVLSNNPNNSKESFIWDIENPITPLVTLTPKHAIKCLQYSNRDSKCLISGLTSGQVCVWDTRNGKDPVSISKREVSHREVVTSILWIVSRNDTDFFSGSTDGAAIWWDIRKLNEPQNRLLMDPIKTNDQELSRSYGINVLEYEHTIPTKFMCGTQQGIVFSCNRKGKTPVENISYKIPCNFGPINTLSRNPTFLKNFLTVGDWGALIWSEDCRESSVIIMKTNKEMLTNGAWSPVK